MYSQEIALYSNQPTTNIRALSFSYLYNFFLYNHDPARFSTLYVLPAFDVLGPMGREDYPNIMDVPQTKEELMAMRPSGQLEVFHAYHVQGHRATNYKKWYGCNKSLYYQAKYEYMYEPYVVGTVHAIHRFDEVSLLSMAAT